MIKEESLSCLCFFKGSLDVILLFGAAMDGEALDQLGFKVIWSEAV